MNKKDEKRIHEFYTNALETFGGNVAQSVGWSDKENQVRRFNLLLGVTDVNKASVLDVGCGLGDLYGYIKERQISISYTGIDLIPQFIQLAGEKYTEGRFLKKNIFSMEEHFDYVLSSGALSFKVDNNKNYYFEMIKKMYRVANCAVAFNMLNKNAHVDDDTYAAYTPKEVSDFCGIFAERVEVATGYLPQDFTVYLYK